MLKKIDILGVGITDASKDEILEYVFNFVSSGSEKGYIVTPNPEIITHAQAHTRYREILNKATVSLCDGVGVAIAARLMDKSLHGRIAGVDFMEEVCKESVRKGVGVGFLGGKRGVALRASECLKAKLPGLRVGFVGEEWQESGIRRSLDTEKKTQGQEEVDILFVAFGFPKQEEWIAENLSKIPVKMAMGVGGAFDYISGAVPRSPFLMRAVGLEWLFRLIVQPWRIKRQLALVRFMGLVLKSK